MRKFELQLIDVLRVQSYSGDFKHMSKFICKKINGMGLTYTKDKLGNIYVVKGESEVYPTMACHIDTVHRFNPYYQVHQAGRNLFAVDKTNCKKLGVGGDDKVGIFITLKMLEEREIFKAAFFVDEEIGCVGSRGCNFDFFKDSSLVLECDRKGNDDFVNSISGTRLYSKEFSEAISGILRIYGRKEVSGGMTDVLEIAYKTDICVANMSCGYYEPHSDDEYVNIDDVLNTYNMCSDIYDSIGFELWRVSEERYERSYYNGYSYTSYGTASIGSQSSRFDLLDDVEMDEWNNSFKSHSEREYLEHGLACAVCNSHSTQYDDQYKEIYCHSCGAWMTEEEYLEFIDNSDGL
jgi:hypothetical protein